jgi:hypothetical protein
MVSPKNWGFFAPNTWTLGDFHELSAFFSGPNPQRRIKGAWQPRRSKALHTSKTATCSLALLEGEQKETTHGQIWFIIPSGYLIAMEN